eukprot:2445522-Prymnesium_polylepis.1
MTDSGSPHIRAIDCAPRGMGKSYTPRAKSHSGGLPSRAQEGLAAGERGVRAAVRGVCACSGTSAGGFSRQRDPVSRTTGHERQRGGSEGQ